MTDSMMSVVSSERSVSAIRERLVEITVDQMAGEHSLEQKNKLTERNMSSIREYETRLEVAAKDNARIDKERNNVYANLHSTADGVKLQVAQHKVMDTNAEELFSAYREMRAIVDAVRDERKAGDEQIKTVAPQIAQLTRTKAHHAQAMQDAERRVQEAQRDDAESKAAAVAAELMCTQLKHNHKKMRSEIESCDTCTQEIKAQQRDVDAELHRACEDADEGRRQLTRLRERSDENESCCMHVQRIIERKQDVQKQLARATQNAEAEQKKNERVRHSVDQQQQREHSLASQSSKMEARLDTDSPGLTRTPA